MALLVLALYLGVVSTTSLTCLLIFLVGNANGAGFMDKAYRVVFVYPPRVLEGIIWRLAGEKGRKKYADVLHYIFKTNNCLVQVFYVVLLCGGYGLFCYAGHPYIPNSYLSNYHKYTASLSIGVCLISFIACSMSDPGIIHETNVDTLVELYPYDDFTFHPNQKCRTCKLVKPARSKHCAVCNHCVIRFDHHCVWIGNDVGALNVGQFIVFLTLHAVLCCYGAVALPRLLLGIIERKQIWKAMFVDPVSGNRYAPSWTLIGQYLATHHLIVVGLALTCILFAFILSGFSFWHIYMAFFQNCTTNENFKSATIVTRAKHRSGSSCSVTEENRDDTNDDRGRGHSGCDHGKRTGKRQSSLGITTNGGKIDASEYFEKRYRILRETYDGGLWENFMEVMFPRRWLTRRWEGIVKQKEAQEGQGVVTRKRGTAVADSTRIHTEGGEEAPRRRKVAK